MTRSRRTAPGFDQFWEAYPRKTARLAALKAWLKLAPDVELQVEILAAIARQKTWPQWLKDDGLYIPHASTWLNNERWTDEETWRAPSFEEMLKARGLQ